MRAYLLSTLKFGLMLLPMASVLTPAFAQEPSRWGGFYAGLNAGYAWRADKGTIVGDVPVGGNGNFVVNNAFYGIASNTPTSASLSLSEQGTIGGAQLGYNWMLSRQLLLGVELDIQRAGLKSDETASRSTAAQRLQVISTSSLDWFATARGRVGVLVDRNLLLFGTAGWAIGQSSITTDVNNIGVGIANGGGGTFFFCNAGQHCMTGADSRRSTGWVVGGGAEWAVLPNITLRAEYLHIDLGSQAVTATMVPVQPPGNPPAFVTSTVNNSFDVVRAALNYRF